MDSFYVSALTRVKASEKGFTTEQLRSNEQLRATMIEEAFSELMTRRRQVMEEEIDALEEVEYRPPPLQHQQRKRMVINKRNVATFSIRQKTSTSASWEQEVEEDEMDDEDLYYKQEELNGGAPWNELAEEGDDEPDSIQLFNPPPMVDFKEKFDGFSDMEDLDNDETASDSEDKSLSNKPPTQKRRYIRKIPKPATTTSTTTTTTNNNAPAVERGRVIASLSDAQFGIISRGSGRGIRPMVYMVATKKEIEINQGQFIEIKSTWSDEEVIERVYEAGRMVPQMSDLSVGTRVVYKTKSETITGRVHKLPGESRQKRCTINVLFDGPGDVSKWVPTETLRLIPDKAKEVVLRKDRNHKGPKTRAEMELHQKEEAELEHALVPPSKKNGWKQSIVVPSAIRKAFHDGPVKYLNSVPGSTSSASTTTTTTTAHHHEDDDEEDEDDGAEIKTRVTSSSTQRRAPLASLDGNQAGVFDLSDAKGWRTTTTTMGGTSKMTAASSTTSTYIAPSRSSSATQPAIPATALTRRRMEEEAAAAAAAAAQDGEEADGDDDNNQAFNPQVVREMAQKKRLKASS